MHFFWFYCLIIWGSTWCATVVYPDFIVGHFTWGHFISVLLYEAINIVVSIPFVAIALFTLYQTIKHTRVQLKYHTIHLEMILPLIGSVIGSVYLFMNITMLTVLIVLVYMLLRFIFGTKGPGTISQLQPSKYGQK